MRRTIRILLLLAVTAAFSAYGTGTEEQTTASSADDWSAIYRP